MKIFLLAVLLLVFPQQDEYKWGRPTTRGINAYVERNWLVFIADYQTHVNDTLFYEPFIVTDDLSDYYSYNSGDLGYYEYPDNIIITNEPRYIDYELSRLSRYKRQQYRETNQFVRGVVMHELTHCYFYQNIKMVQRGDSLHRDFREGLRMIPTDNYGTQFLEEGFCEYVTQDMGETIAYDEHVVLNKNSFLRERNTYAIKYRYSSQYVKPIIEKYGLRYAIQLVVSQKPPTQEEILNPNLYYDRLKWNP